MRSGPQAEPQRGTSRAAADGSAGPGWRPLRQGWRRAARVLRILPHERRIQRGMIVAASRVPSGSTELDDILGGGYAGSRVHLVEGRPGCGKTTLALQFLMSARDRGEATL